MVFLSSLFSAILMWLSIWLLTRCDSGRATLRPVLWVSLLASVLVFVSLKYLGAWGLGVTLGGVVVGLKHWCFLSLGRAVMVAVIWLLGQIVFGRFVSPIF